MAAAVVLAVHGGEVLIDKRKLLLLAVPSCLYTIQNNLMYVSLANVSAALFQVTTRYTDNGQSYFAPDLSSQSRIVESHDFRRRRWRRTDIGVLNRTA